MVTQDTEVRRGRPTSTENRLRCYADNAASPPMQLLAGAAVDRGITIAALSRLTKRDIKTLLQSMDAKKPRKETIAAISAGIGFPPVVAKVLCNEFTVSDGLVAMLHGLFAASHLLETETGGRANLREQLNFVVSRRPHPQDSIIVGSRCILIEYGLAKVNGARTHFCDLRTDALNDYFTAVGMGFSNLSERATRTRAEDHFAQLEMMMTDLRVAASDRHQIDTLLEKYRPGSPGA